ncbi:hypothetical protein Tco_1164787 [Tanacetum coccineum]
MENEHELSYETLTRVYLGSYEHYKGVGAEVEHSKPGFELQGAKMVETGQNRDFRLRTARVTTLGLRFLVSFASFLLKVCLKSEMGHVYKLGRDVEKLVDVVYKLGSSFGWACAFHQDKASSVKVPVANVTLFSLAHLLRENTDSVRVSVQVVGITSLTMAAVCASTAVVRSAISCRMASKVMAGVSDVDVLLGGIL